MISIKITEDLLKFFELSFPINHGVAEVNQFGEHLYFETENVELALKVQTIAKNK